MHPLLLTATTTTTDPNLSRWVALAALALLAYRLALIGLFPYARTGTATAPAGTATASTGGPARAARAPAASCASDAGSGTGFTPATAPADTQATTGDHDTMDR